MGESLSEPKAQRWRALVVYTDKQEGLLYLGANYSQVLEHYDESYHDLLDDEERSRVKTIKLQKWVGAPDGGRWEDQQTLDIPENMLLPVVTRPRAS